MHRVLWSLLSWEYALSLQATMLTREVYFERQNSHRTYDVTLVFKLEVHHDGAFHCIRGPRVGARNGRHVALHDSFLLEIQSFVLSPRSFAWQCWLKCTTSSACWPVKTRFGSSLTTYLSGRPSASNTWKRTGRCLTWRRRSVTATSWSDRKLHLPPCRLLVRWLSRRLA